MAILGTVLIAIAIILKLVNQHPDWIEWLTLFGALLIGIEVSLVWYHGGRYRYHR